MAGIDTGVTQNYLATCPISNDIVTQDKTHPFMLRKEQSKMAAINPIQLEKYLKGINYPVSKADLLKQAEKNGADEQARSTLEQLPDKTFDAPTDVSKAVGAINRK